MKTSLLVLVALSGCLTCASAFATSRTPLYYCESSPRAGNDKLAVAIYDDQQNSQYTMITNRIQGEHVAKLGESSGLSAYKLHGTRFASAQIVLFVDTDDSDTQSNSGTGEINDTNENVAAPAASEGTYTGYLQLSNSTAANFSSADIGESKNTPQVLQVAVTCRARK